MSARKVRLSCPWWHQTSPSVKKTSFRMLDYPYNNLYFRASGWAEAVRPSRGEQTSGTWGYFTKEPPRAERVNSGPAATALCTCQCISLTPSWKLQRYRYPCIPNQWCQLDVLRLHPNQLSEAGAIMCNLCAMDMIDSRHGVPFSLPSQFSPAIFRSVTTEMRRFWLPRRLIVTVQYHGRRYPCQVGLFFAN